jgi:integral membrane sensor domain MASE1
MPAWNSFANLHGMTSHLRGVPSDLVRPSYVRRLLTTGPLIVAVAAAYFVVAYFGFAQPLGAQSVRLVWPQFGLGLAALLVLGLRMVPAIAIGSFFVLVVIGRSPTVSVALAAATTISLVVACLLLRQLGFRIELDRLRDALALVAAAFAGAVLVASLNTSAVVSFGLERSEEFWSRWLLVWMGSGIGALVVAPTLIVLSRLRWPPRVRPSRAVEVICLLVATAVVTFYATHASTELLFLAFPLLMWGALRFQLAATAPCALVVCVAAVYAASHGLGPFEGPDLASSLTTIQAFNGAVALTALVLAVAITERNKAHKDLQRAAGQLAVLIDKLDRRMRPHLFDQPSPKDRSLRL